MVKIIKGDLVAHPDYPGHVGRASHADDSGRWVVWTTLGGHWAAGSYKPTSLVYVGAPEPGQPKLKL
jgi:hypothetical protein